MPNKRSKKTGRNEACPCGSGQKYKRCHGRFSAPPLGPSSEQIKTILGAHEAQELLRQHQQGKGKPIISAELADHRIVAVGDKIHFAKNQKTFIDFLDTYIRNTLGTDWGNREIKKPLEERHQIMQWYDSLCAFQRKHRTKPVGEIDEAPITGLINAYYGLAYNLYLLQHNAELQAYLVRRLKQADCFYAAYYETYVSAWFILAEFVLKIENEEDSTRTHVEFIATKNGRSYSVEAKARMPGKPHFDVGTQLYKALKKEANHPRFVFIDMNVGTDIDPEQFAADATSAVRGREPKLTINGEAAPPAYVFVTNQPYHLCLEDQNLPRICLCLGFKIPDFGHDVPFPSYVAAHKAREKHAHVVEVQKAFADYKFPITFDGEISQFAFGEAKRRFNIGEQYEIAKGIVGTLTSGLVVAEQKKAYLFFHTEDDKAPVMTTQLSDAEIAAYRAHPDTFFGQVVKQSRNVEDPMDLFDFFLQGYKETPRDKILEFFKDSSDFEELKKLSDDELHLVYAERCTLSVMQKSEKSGSD